MTALAKDLMGVGLAAEQARRIGFTPVTTAGAGTTQAAAATIAGNLATITTAGGATAVIPSSSVEVGDSIQGYVQSSTTALLYVPGSNTIAGVTTTAPISIATLKGFILTRMSRTDWSCVLGAAIS